MEELAVLQVVWSEAEAEVIRGLLRSEGIPSVVQRTTLGGGMADGFAGTGGPREILVHAPNLASARRVLERSSSSRASSRPRRRSSDPVVKTL